jgi:hypothetical protein
MKKRIIEEYMDNFASFLIISLIAKAIRENQRMRELLEGYGERLAGDVGVRRRPCYLEVGLSPPLPLPRICSCASSWLGAPTRPLSDRGQVHTSGPGLARFSLDTAAPVKYLKETNLRLISSSDTLLNVAY